MLETSLNMSASFCADSFRRRLDLSPVPVDMRTQSVLLLFNNSQCGRSVRLTTSLMIASNSFKLVCVMSIEH